ncbi:uncharacterized protein LOC121969149 isoform X2 [Zingiber officinale]|uniref:uncharacterized protein LOC121969149 isoform X2 n=1 Tax=Zingiber officinale TaxID=94328 RepID=UPI001C4CDD41|nr:uncharacterized protein LOC121969149 isoform X2 [Zingiber officinale]
MGASKLLIVSIVISLLFVGVCADAEIQEEVVVEHEDPDSRLKLELEQLRFEISALESSNIDKEQELTSKDERITHLEKIMKEKSLSIASLRSNMESIQKKGDLDTKEIVKKAQARVDELEEQVEKLTAEIKLQNSETDSLNAWAIEAEMKVKDLSLKLENLQKTNNEQNNRIQKTEHALQVAEEELIRVHLEATTKSKELTQAHGAWFPPWFATHFSYYKELATIYWKEHGQPVLHVLLQQVSEKLNYAQQLMEPHFETAKTTWVPVIREQWLFFVSSAEPYVQTMSSKTVDIYNKSKCTISSHVVKVQEFSDPYFQAAKRFSQPYIDQVATITKPHVEKVRVGLSPYSDHVSHAYGKFLKSATTYHLQVQVGIQEFFKNHEIIKPLATKELVWFMASAFLALPIFLVYRLLSYILGPKHRHADK